MAELAALDLERARFHFYSPTECVFSDARVYFIFTFDCPMCVSDACVSCLLSTVRCARPHIFIFTFDRTFATYYRGTYYRDLLSRLTFATYYTDIPHASPVCSRVSVLPLRSPSLSALRSPLPFALPFHVLGRPSGGRQMFLFWGARGPGAQTGRGGSTHREIN